MAVISSSRVNVGRNLSDGNTDVPSGQKSEAPLLSYISSIFGYVFNRRLLIIWFQYDIYLPMTGVIASVQNVRFGCCLVAKSCPSLCIHILILYTLYIIYNILYTTHKNIFRLIHKIKFLYHMT